MSAVGQEQNAEEAFQEMLARLSPETRGLAAEYDMGEQAKEFINSDLGRFMVGAAQQDSLDAQEKLKHTLPFRWRRIYQLQQESLLADKFLLYLKELLIRGRAAEQGLEQRDET